MFSNGRLIVSAMAFLLIAGCGDNDAATRQSSQEHLDVDLAQISVELALMKAQIELDEYVNCIVSDDLSKTYLSFAENYPDPMLTDQMNNASREILETCAIYQSALSSLAPIMEKIKETRQIPSPLYSFVLLLEKDGAYQENEIGIFSTKEECFEVEAQARQARLATKECEVWVSLLKNK